MTRFMRKRFALMAAVLMAAFFVTGCAGLFDVKIEIDDPVAAKIKLCSIAGRRIAKYTMSANPTLIPEAEVIVAKVKDIIGDPE